MTEERERTDLTVSSDDTVGKYNQKKFANELGISQGKVSQHLQLADAIKKAF